MNALNNLKLHLKNKEKGCNYCFDILCGGKEIRCGSKYKKNYETSGWDKSKDILYCKICQAEIAILEQAIAEMQKQRQEILEKIDLYLMVTKGNYECQKALEELKEQLNQPKTEK
jgi:hypothetical protein